MDESDLSILDVPKEQDSFDALFAVALVTFDTEFFYSYIGEYL
jgi:hypothetical protein